jgi:hypothetical protein
MLRRRACLLCITAVIGSTLTSERCSVHSHNQLETGVSPTFKVRRAASARTASMMAVT